MNFSYAGRDSDGNRIEGNIEANNLTAAVSELKRRNIIPVQVNPGKVTRQRSQTSSSALVNLLTWRKKVSLDDKILFCRQMYALTKSGIPILRAINGLADTSRNEYFGEILRGVYHTLQNGSELSTAMSQYPNFGPLFVAMIRVGESTGRLDLAFQSLVNHLEMEKTTSRQISSALRYPTLVISAIVVAMGVINWLVIPAFRKVFAQLGSDLPLPTRILIATSEFSVHYWWLIVAIALLMTIAWVKYIHTDSGRLFWDRKKLRIPIIGAIVEKITIVRFLQPFSIMLASGVPMLQSLRVSARTVNNAYIASRIDYMVTGIERGETLLATAATSGMFNPLILQMIAVGEETGQVSEMLNDITGFYDQEIQYDLKKVADNIEPILLVMMGAMVLVLALGVFLPMWDLSSAARK